MLCLGSTLFNQRLFRYFGAIIVKRILDSPTSHVKIESFVYFLQYCRRQLTESSLIDY